MPISTRLYVLEPDGALKRIPMRVVNGLVFGADSVPAYAGTSQRIVQVLVENEGGRPVQILDVTGSIWAFDDAGKVDRSLRRAAGEWFDVAYQEKSKDPAGRVVSLVPELKRRELEARYRWSVTQDIVDRIAADIWPGIYGPAPEVGSVKGTAPRRPPLSWQARDTLLLIGKSLDQVDHALSTLSEPGLRGLAFEAERTATVEHAALWRGVAAHARHRRAVLAAHRTGRGGWFAVVTSYRREQGRERVIDVADARAKTQREAIAAGARLMADKAHWLGPDVRLSVVILSALEWRAVDV